MPSNHIPVRSFLGAPLLNHSHEIVGGLLLGHTLPDVFVADDELLLSGLAAQAAVSLENARLHRLTQHNAHELNVIFESITDGVALVDPFGIPIRENEKARSIRADLERSGISAQAFRELLSTPLQSALQGKMHEPITVTVLDARQEVHIYQVRVSPLRSSSLEERSHAPLHARFYLPSSADIAGVVIIWNDVSAAHRLLVERQMNAETTVRYSLLQTLLDKLPIDAYLVTGSDLRLIMTNQTSLTAWGARWFHGQSMLDFLKSGEIRVFDERGFPLEPRDFAVWRALLNRESVYQQQEVIHRKDGTAIPVLVNAVPLDLPLLQLSPGNASSLSDNKTVPCALLVHQDVSALKDAEKLKDEFIAIAAHELRSPLAVIRGFAQTILVQTARGHGAPLADWQLEALQGVDQSTIRLTELVDELMDVTRLQAGRLTFQFEPTDLIALIQRVISRLQVTTQNHTLLFRTELEYAVANVDPHRTEQILSNILVNAIKYTPQGGPIEMHMGMQTQTSSFLLSVHDHGIGIPAAQRSRVFERFERADNARSFGISGTGLGLYLCRELVEQQGGNIWFSSTEGRGTTFFVTFPLSSLSSVASSGVRLK